MLDFAPVNRTTVFYNLRSAGYEGSLDDMLYSFYRDYTGIDSLDGQYLEYLTLVSMLGLNKLTNRLGNSDLFRLMYTSGYNIEDVYRELYFVFDPINFGLYDSVSKATLNTLKSSVSYTEDINGNIVEVPADKATVHPLFGMRSNAGYTNLVINSEDLSQLDSENIDFSYSGQYQSLTYTTDAGLYSFSRDRTINSELKTFSTQFKIRKDSYQKIYFRPYDESFETNSIIIDISNKTVSGNTGVFDFYELTEESGFFRFSCTYTINGALYNQIGVGTHEIVAENTAPAGATIYIKDLICSETPYPMPYILTNGTAVSSSDEFASATTGSSFTLADMPKALSSLQGVPSRLDLRLYNGYELFDTSNQGGLVTPVDGTTTGIGFDGNQTVSLSDGTTTISQAFASTSKGYKDITVLYNGSDMQLVVDGVPTTITAFDGSWNPETALNFFWNNLELWYSRKMTIKPIRSTDWIE